MLDSFSNSQENIQRSVLDRVLPRPMLLFICRLFQYYYKIKVAPVVPDMNCIELNSIM